MARTARPNIHNRTFDKQTGIWIGGDYDVKVNLTFSVQVSGFNPQRSAPPNALFPRSGETMAPEKYNQGIYEGPVVKPAWCRFLSNRSSSAHPRRRRLRSICPGSIEPWSGQMRHGLLLNIL